MKRSITFLTILLAASLVLNFSALPLQAAEADVDFDVMKDGTIKAGPHTFKNFSDYFKSKFFKERGKCKTQRFPKHKSTAAADAFIEGYPSDCDFTQTVIRSEYWPNDPSTIPVVFHIIYKSDGTGDISDQRVIDQVTVLNEDYRALPGTMGEQGFDTKIEFVLAGITRTANDKWFRDRGQEYYYKTALAWDVTKYCNIYVNSASGYLGYSYFPQDSAGEWWDGITLLYETVGGRDNGYPPYDQGRTLVHEMGHYVGLEHTFYGGCCNGYTCGDLIVDTEAEETAHYYCDQTYTCGTPDPIHNYMNYTDDLCMYQFTSEQSNRAVCALVNYRSSMIQPPPADFFVSDITMSIKLLGKKYVSEAVITIMDVESNPVSDATVFVEWSGVVSGTDSGTTGSDGTVLLKSPGTKSTGTFTITVTNVTHPMATYRPDLNVETSDSISN
jgi:hypothetical protein